MPANRPHGRPERFPALDGVRGLAILLVVVHNAAWMALPSDTGIVRAFVGVAARGWIGVQLFFVLSGFLITGILLDSLGSERYFRSFYVRRILRIFPLYYTFLGTFLLLGTLLADDEKWLASVRDEQWWYWCYLSNWAEAYDRGIQGLAHLWSLGIEEQFYLVWPLLLAALRPRGMVWLCTAVVFGTPFVRMVLNGEAFPSQATYYFTIARWDAMASGALLAMMVRRPGARAWLDRHLAPVTVAAGVALAAMIAVQHGAHHGEAAVQTGVQAVGQTLVALHSGSLIFYCFADTGRSAAILQRVFGLGWLRTLGKYSYAI